MALERKVKSIQVFRKPVKCISQGDRAGICVTQFDAKQFERGLICSPKIAKYIHCAIIPMNRIKYFKYPINSRSKFHVTIGYETALATIILFAAKTANDFNFDEDYEFINNLNPVFDENHQTAKYFALIEFDKPVLATDNSLVIASKLDVDASSNTCRIGFWGNLLQYSKDKDYCTSFLPKLKVYKVKTKIGSIERIVDDNTAIVKNMFKKETRLDSFLGLKVTTSFGDIGRIDSSFGKSGKIKVCFENSFNGKVRDIVEKKKNDSDNRNNKVEVTLSFKKYVFDINKRIYQ